MAEDWPHLNSIDHPIGRRMAEDGARQIVIPFMEGNCQRHRIHHCVCRVCRVMPARGPGEGCNPCLTPPWYDPSHEQSYSFSTYAQDVQLWLMMTVAHPHPQSVAIVSRLGGVAREYTRAITPGELRNGGVFEGVQLGSASYITTCLKLCFAQLDGERRLVAMTQRLAFTRGSQ